MLCRNRLMSIHKTRQYFQGVKLTSILGIIVAVVTLVSAITTSVFWIDERYADQDEVSKNLDTLSISINKNLATINDNIILLGNAFYDQRISEVESLIKAVEAIENPNPTEVQFLQSLTQSLAELKRKQQKLLDTKLESVGDTP